ncbi:MAG: hypothetical protein IH975_09630 [Nitrospinae bacterium]|nr:hypothetical protein [Nitrospinota bacterium]
MRTLATHEPTRHEIELRHDDGRAYLVGYVARTTGQALRETVQEPERWAAITRITGRDAFAIVNPRSVAEGYRQAGWTLRYSGHTQRDRRSTGELPFILDAKLEPGS